MTNVIVNNQLDRKLDLVITGDVFVAALTSTHLKASESVIDSK